MGLGDGEMTGPTLYDILSVIKGHGPEGHKVRMISIVIFTTLVIHLDISFSCTFLFFRKCKLLISLFQFSSDQPVSSETVGYVKKPSLKDKIHCVVFVVDASQIPEYPKGLTTTFQQLREHISDLGEQKINKQLNQRFCDDSDSDTDTFLFLPQYMMNFAILKLFCCIPVMLRSFLLCELGPRMFS